ncbi:hypothetical protein NL676_035047 [Syzygium grande]|nr:hypothetical protein NL676_035047 [Syzygium grande]
MLANCKIHVYLSLCCVSWYVSVGKIAGEPCLVSTTLEATVLLDEDQGTRTLCTAFVILREINGHGAGYVLQRHSVWGKPDRANELAPRPNDARGQPFEEPVFGGSKQLLSSLPNKTLVKWGRSDWDRRYFMVTLRTMKSVVVGVAVMATMFVIAMTDMNFGGARDGKDLKED